MLRTARRPDARLSIPKGGWLVGLAAALAIGGSTPKPDPAANSGISADPANWAGFGRTPGSQHYSPLDGLNTGNVGKLRLAWSYNLPPGDSLSAPVAVDGVVYVASGYSVVAALEAATGRQIWRYDPQIAKVAGVKLRLGWGSRGLAYENGRIFIGAQDGRLIALDARTGAPAWSVLTTEPGDLRYITGPPRVFNGKVVVGHGGGDVGVTRGYVTCYDAATGRMLWRFYTVPGNPDDGFNDPGEALAARTWSGDYWTHGGGAAVWHAITYDSELNRFYIGTGNALPEDRGIRSQGHGDNLFSASIVALDADSGRYIWHYQLNPGEEWDYDASMDIQLATLDIGGKPRKVLMQAPKNGFFYVIDRANGKLISAAPFAKVTWASKIDLATGRPVEAPDVHGEAPFALWPGPTGAHNWLPMAFSPRTGLVYIPVSERPVVMTAGRTDYAPNLPGGNTSHLTAWDPRGQKAVWRVETPGFWAGGVIATGGDLVFQGQIDHRFNAYSARSGRRLWSFDARAPVVAPPITYSVNGVQYVTVLTGYTGAGSIFTKSNPDLTVDYRTMSRRVLTFALNGAAELPPAPPPAVRTPVKDPDFTPDKARATKGLIAYNYNCMLCHGLDAVAGGSAPDLRWSYIATSRQAFDSVVRDGGLLTEGMPRFDDLAPETTEDIRFYLRSRAQAGASAH